MTMISNGNRNFKCHALVVTLTLVILYDALENSESFVSNIIWNHPMTRGTISTLSFSSPSVRMQPFLYFSKKIPSDEENEENFIGSNSSGDGNEEGSTNKIFYDDFVDFQPDTASISKSDTSLDLKTLQARITKTKDDLVARDIRLANNWRSGYWSVRGFSLDKYDPIQQIRQESSQTEAYYGRKREDMMGLYSDITANDEETKSTPPIITVSKITLDTERCDESIATSSGEIEDDILIAVGRTDGSLCIVQLGNEYMTNFKAVPTVSLVPKDSSNSQPSSSSADAIVKYSSKLVRAEDNLLSPLNTPLDGDNDDEDEDPLMRSNIAPSSSSEENMVPFKILYQFQAAESGSISALLMEGTNIFTSNGGDVKLWELPSMIESMQQEEIVMKPKVAFQGAHSKNVIGIKSVSSDDTLLLTVSRDGSLAIWNRNTGDLTHSFLIKDQYNHPIPILSVDVWNGEENQELTIVFIGLENGYVQGYTIKEILLSKTLDRNPTPSCNFLAHGTTTSKGGSGVTALCCAGKGASGLLQRSTSSSTSSIILLTGGADGIVKQW